MTLHDRHTVFLDRGAKFAVWVIFIACPHSWAGQVVYDDTVFVSVGWDFKKNSDSFLYLKHQLWSLIVFAPLDQLADPAMFTLGLCTKPWYLWLKHCCLLDIVFLHPFQVDYNFFSYHFPVLCFSSAYDDTLPKIMWCSSSKPFPSSLVRGNLNGIKSQDCFWRWKQFMPSCAASVWSLVCIFSFLQFHDFTSLSVKM